MLLSAVSVPVVAQSSSEIPEGLMNNPVHYFCYTEECPDPLGFCYKHILQEQNFRMAL